MPRDHARIHTDIWGDDDWLDLSPEAQHLYFVLYTRPPSFCGGGDWQPKKIAARARCWTSDSVSHAAGELQDGLFLLLDLDTDEYLIRSWIKHDGLYRVQNMAVSIANARATFASRKLRGVVVFEVSKLRDAEPNLESWKKDAVTKMLDQTAIDPASQQWSSPWPSPNSRGKPSPCDSPSPTESASPSDSGRATPSPSPAPNSSSSKDNTAPSGARGAHIEDDWEPRKATIDAMRDKFPHLSLPDLQEINEEFVDYWKSIPGARGRRTDWEATWRNRVRDVASRRRSNGRTVPTSDLRVKETQALKLVPGRLELG
jgi:hypothetical protein